MRTTHATQRPPIVRRHDRSANLRGSGCLRGLIAGRRRPRRRWWNRDTGRRAALDLGQTGSDGQRTKRATRRGDTRDIDAPLFRRLDAISAANAFRFRARPTRRLAVQAGAGMGPRAAYIEVANRRREPAQPSSGLARCS